MKKLISLILVILMALSITSCTSTVTNNPQETLVTSDESTTLLENEPEQEDIKAAVFWYDFGDAFLENVRYHLNSQLTEAGINFTNYDAAKTQATQNAQIDSAISQGTNLLIVNIVDTAAIDAAQVITDKAKAADIPIIFFNREISDDVINSYENACFVGTRATEAKESQGIMAGEYIVTNYDAVDLNKDGQITYIYMMGQLGGPEVDHHWEYYSANIISCNKVLTAAGKPELVFYDAANTDKYLPSNWSKTEAFNLMETALGTNPVDGDAPIEVIFANNDDAALGCIEALNAKGWNTGDAAKTIPVFGIDYTADAQAAIEAGKMTGSILQSYESMAETVAALASNVAAGEAVFANTEAYNVDKDAAKIRVPYEIKA